MDAGPLEPQENIYRRGAGRPGSQARFFILCLLAALAAAVAIPFIGADYWRERLKEWGDLLPPNVDMRFTRLTLNEADKTGRTLVLNAATALYNQSRDVFDLEEVRARVAQGEGVYDITAATGRYDQSAKVVRLTGRVRVVSGDGDVLSSEDLTMKFEEGLMIGEREFCYAAPGNDLSGSAFVYDARSRRLSVEGRTHLLIF